MIRVNVLCEGPTEEQFVQKILYQHFLERGIILTARSMYGGFNYDRLKHNIIEWLNNDKDAYVTTLIDLYGVNSRYPGYDSSRSMNPTDKAAAIEAAVREDVLAWPHLHNRKLIPYFQLHEFEALLFSSPEIMEEWLSLSHEIPRGQFSAIRNSFSSPEHINDSPQTAPSKRIEAIVPSYEKVTDGIIIAQEIGLARLRAACAHLNQHLTALEALSLAS